ncbi:MAG TPA: hypothetical protein DCP69_07595 [Candidatus Omnitrophica bacterium]|nr:hypothetical protein [Candidatus Omnitrophota bacterium]
MKTYWKQGVSDLAALYLNGSETPVTSKLNLRGQMRTSMAFGMAMDDTHKKLIYRMINLIVKALSLWGLAPWVLLLISELLRLLYDLVEYYRRKAEAEGTADETTEPEGGNDAANLP